MAHSALGGEACGGFSPSPSLAPRLSSVACPGERLLLHPLPPPLRECAPRAVACLPSLLRLLAFLRWLVRGGMASSSPLPPPLRECGPSWGGLCSGGGFSPLLWFLAPFGGCSCGNGSFESSSTSSARMCPSCGGLCFGGGFSPFFGDLFWGMAFSSPQLPLPSVSMWPGWWGGFLPGNGFCGVLLSASSMRMCSGGWCGGLGLGNGFYESSPMRSRRRDPRQGGACGVVCALRGLGVARREDGGVKSATPRSSTSKCLEDIVGRF
ncbi:hypothetical protein NL676_021220 [Syzygium grande]|nr:hypothetical protein NL676_021220 [Syzygium grande]